MVWDTRAVAAGEQRAALPAARWPAAGAAAKVPAVTAWFWAVKILTTGMGEATSDYLVHTISPVIAVGIGAAGLIAALAAQFAVRRYVTVLYWLAVTMVAVFGTMEADVLHVALGVPYAVSTAGFAAALAAIFAVWHATEKTLSIHSIRTRRREFFYWATVMATFALGTAAGDLTAYTLGLGYLASGVMFTAVIIVPLLGYRLLRLSPVAMFWLAYILTRPLGASYADWLGVPRELGGEGFGRGLVSLVLTVIIAAGVGYLVVTGRDSPARQAQRRGSGPAAREWTPAGTAAPGYPGGGPAGPGHHPGGRAIAAGRAGGGRHRAPRR